MHIQTLVKVCSFFSKDIKQKRNSDKNERPQLCYISAKNDMYILNLDIDKMNALIKFGVILSIFSPDIGPK